MSRVRNLIIKKKIKKHSLRQKQSQLLRNVSCELCSSGSDLHLKCPCLTVPKIGMNLKRNLRGRVRCKTSQLQSNFCICRLKYKDVCKLINVSLPFTCISPSLRLNSWVFHCTVWRTAPLKLQIETGFNSVITCLDSISCWRTASKKIK